MWPNGNFLNGQKCYHTPRTAHDSSKAIWSRVFLGSTKTFQTKIIVMNHCEMAIRCQLLPFRLVLFWQISKVYSLHARIIIGSYYWNLFHERGFAKLLDICQLVKPSFPENIFQFNTLVLNETSKCINPILL